MARMIKIGRMGDTNRTSIVPVSFSRTMEMEVIIAQISISINPITPGTKIIGTLHLRIEQEMGLHDGT